MLPPKLGRGRRPFASRISVFRLSSAAAVMLQTIFIAEGAFQKQCIIFYSANFFSLHTSLHTSIFSCK